MKKGSFLIALCFAAAVAGAQNVTKVSSDVEIGFEPEGSGIHVVLDAIGAAKSSIEMAAYEFTDKTVADALIQAHRAGVAVRVVIDLKAAHDKYCVLPMLLAAGIPVRLDPKHAISHDKLQILDRVGVEEGSYNFSYASGRGKNAENCLYFRNAPTLAEAYEQHWQLLWDESEPAH